MRIAEKAVHGLTELAGKITGSASDSDIGQTVTIAAPRARVAEFWRDPQNLSRVLGDLGEVSTPAAGRYQWTLRANSGPALPWDSILDEDEHGLQFRGAADDTSAAGATWIRLSFSDAPQDSGTQVSLRTRLPMPGLLAGAAAFAFLYRSRALLQTGEAPTLHHNPSARTGDR